MRAVPVWVLVFVAMACATEPSASVDETGTGTGDGDGEAEGDGDGDAEGDGDGDGDGDAGLGPADESECAALLTEEWDADWIACRAANSDALGLVRAGNGDLLVGGAWDAGVSGEYGVWLRRYLPFEAPRWSYGEGVDAPGTHASALAAIGADRSVMVGRDGHFSWGPWLHVFDLEGEIVWSASEFEDGFDRGFASVAADSDHAVYVVGWNEAEDEARLKYIRKYTSEGLLSWERPLPDDVNEWKVRVVVDGGDRVAVASAIWNNSESRVELYTGTGELVGSHILPGEFGDATAIGDDVLVATQGTTPDETFALELSRMSAEGGLEWSAIVDGVPSVQLGGLSVGPEDNIYTIAATGGAQKSARINQLTPTGELSWSGTLAGLDPAGVVALSPEQIVVAGTTTIESNRPWALTKWTALAALSM